MRRLGAAGSGLALLLLVACTVRVPQQPAADAASLERARRVDAIEALIEAGHYEEAVTAVDKALGDGLNHPRVLLLKGRLKMRGDGTEAALAAIPWFERAVAASPGWFRPRFELAQAHIQAHQLDSAATVAEGVERLAPEHPAGPYAQAVIHRLRGQDEAAAGFIAEALQRDPDFVPALIQAVMLARQGNDREAEREALEHLLRLHGDDPALYRRLGALQEAAGRLADAERSYRTSYRLRPDPTTARHLADLARQRGDTVAAEDWLERAGSSTQPESHDR